MLFAFLNKKKNKQFEEIAERELRENFDVIESLRKHDAGEKEISTRDLKRRLDRVRSTS